MATCYLPLGEETMPDDTLSSRFRDRDIISDVVGRLFVVLGHIQPHERVLSFLKYIPDHHGRWISGQQRYSRVFWGAIDSVVAGFQNVPEIYVAHDPHFGTALLEVPMELVRQHFLPEDRLEEIRKNGPTDRLESLAIGLADVLHDTLGITYSDIGVAGSILWKGHSPEFSDINMNIYGLRNSWALMESYESVGAAEKVRLRKSIEWVRGIARALKRIPALSKSDIEMLFERRFAFYYDDQCIGVTPVLRPEECPIRYGSESYHLISEVPIRTEFDVESVKYGIFNPSIIEGRSSSLDAYDNVRVSRLMVYEGVYNGLFKKGDTLEISGTLQRVHPVGPGCEDFYQLMVGTKTGDGLEFIRLVR